MHLSFCVIQFTGKQNVSPKRIEQINYRSAKRMYDDGVHGVDEVAQVIFKNETKRINKALFLENLYNDVSKSSTILKNVSHFCNKLKEDVYTYCEVSVIVGKYLRISL